MKLLINLPSLRRPAAESGAVVVQKLTDGIPDPYSANRLSLQKAAAWQWFMRGAGVDAQPPAEASRSPPLILMTRSTTHIQKQTSRFANEVVINAAADAPTEYSYASLDDCKELLGSLAHDTAPISYELPQGHEKEGVDLSDSHRMIWNEDLETVKPSNYKKQKEEEIEKQHQLDEGKKSAGHSPYRTYEKVKPSNDKQKRHLHFLGFQKLLHKLGMSRSNNKISDLARRVATMPNEDEAQRHYYHYIHHHHHHYYHGGPSSLEEEEVIRHSHPHYIEHKRMRRHSESGSYYQPQQLCQKLSSSSSLVGGPRGGEVEDYKVKGDCHVFRRHSYNFSEDKNQLPIKFFTNIEEDIVIGQPLDKSPSLAFARRHNSERFTTMSDMTKSTNRSQDIHSGLISRVNSERRHLAERFDNFW